MPHNAMQNAGGGGSLITGALLYAINRIHLADINDLLIIITSLVGLVWVCFKIKGTILDNMIKKKTLEKDFKDTIN